MISNSKYTNDRKSAYQGICNLLLESSILVSVVAPSMKSSIMTIVFSACNLSSPCFRIHGNVLPSSMPFVLLRQLVAAFADTTLYNATSSIDWDVAWHCRTAISVDSWPSVFIDSKHARIGSTCKVA